VGNWKVGDEVRKCVRGKHESTIENDFLSLNSEKINGKPLTSKKEQKIYKYRRSRRGNKRLREGKCEKEGNGVKEPLLFFTFPIRTQYFFLSFSTPLLSFLPSFCVFFLHSR
jgi:hypothetical protein